MYANTMLPQPSVMRASEVKKDEDEEENENEYFTAQNFWLVLAAAYSAS